MATQLQEEPGQTEEILDPQTEERDYETEARSMGWQPPDEFKGAGKQFVDAKTFVERGEQLIPFMKAQMKHLNDQIKEQNKQITKLTKAEQSAYDSAMTDLKAQMKSAVESGDVDKFDKIEAKIDKLRDGMEGSKPDPKQTMAVFDDWRDDNEWYDIGGLAGATESERKARAYADRMAERHAEKLHDMGPEKFFSYIGELVDEKYGDDLKTKKTPREKPMSDVAGVTSRQPNRGAKTGANLPPEAKAQAKRFFEKGIYKTKTLGEAYDKYAKTFEWE